MRYILTLALAIIPCTAVSAQTKADYIKALSRFQKFYNIQQADSITNMFSDEWGKHRSNLWTKKKLQEVYSDYGKMKSFELLLIDPRPTKDTLAYFKTTFEKSSHMTSFSLDKQNKFLTHRFETSDTEIDSLLRTKHISPVVVKKFKK